MITTKFVYLLTENPNYGILLKKAQLIFEECLKNSDAIACNQQSLHSYESNSGVFYLALVILLAIASLATAYVTGNKSNN